MKIAIAFLPLISLVGFAQAPPTAPKPPALARTYPVLKSSFPAQYTTEAHAVGLQGTVHLYVQIEPDGTPSRIQVLHGLGLGLDEKAVEAVKQWRYSPATIEGRAISMGQSVDVEFQSGNASAWRVRLQHAAIEYEMKVKTPRDPVLTRYTAPGTACPPSGNAVTITFHIGPDGVPSKITSLSGEQGEAAIRAISDWRYEPGTRDGKATSAEARVELECGPRAAAPGAVSRIGGDVTAPVVTFKPEPTYTREAHRAKLKGEVRLLLMVDQRGLPSNIFVIAPLGMGLDEKAMGAVDRWRFTPGMRDGKPVATIVVIAVSFHLL